MNRDKQIVEEMAKDLENHTCMSEFQAEIASQTLYSKGYRKASEVAREIFEEIEKVRMQHTFGNIDGSELNVKLYYLKKKYTEEVK